VANVGQLEKDMNDKSFAKPKKQKALYGKLLNDLYYSSKTIKGDKELKVNLEFVEDYKEATAEQRFPRHKKELTLTLTNNQDGTATLTIKGSKGIKVEDRRGKLD
jgi:hypothetical protein